MKENKDMARLDYDLHEMLTLRSKGWTYLVLGIKYGKDHSTIVHQCLKWGVNIGTSVPTREELQTNTEYRAKVLLKDLETPAIEQASLPPEEDGPICPGKSYAEYMAEAEKRPAEKHYKEKIGYQSEWNYGKLNKKVNIDHTMIRV